MLYNTDNIDYVRKVLAGRISRPQPALALYYDNSTGAALSISVTTTAVSANYQGTTKTVTYVDLTIEELCANLNQLGFPIKARPLIGNTVLESGDLISTGLFKSIPSSFDVYDQIPDNGIVIRTKRVSIRHKSRFQISLLEPISESPVLPWYPRISIGSFTQVINGKQYLFSVPEYASQTWSTIYGRPFKDVVGEKPIFVSANTYRLRRTPVYWNGENITLFNGEAPLSRKSIVDVDVNNGYIYLNESISYVDDLTVDYSYKEEAYEYRYLNINCHFRQNPLLIGKFVLLYMLPHEGTAYVPKKRTVYHTIANSIPEAIDSISLDDPTVPILIVGAYSVQQVQGSDKAKMLDTRVKGGGLKDIIGPTSPVHIHEDILEPDSDQVSIESVYKEAANFFDIPTAKWDGEIYPGAASVIVDLPLELSTVLPLEDIKQKSTKFLAAGVYPLFDFTDRPLPDVSTYSRQISCFNSGEIHWGPTKYTIPGSVFDEEWSEEVNKYAPVQYTEGQHVLAPNTETGAFQYYLKSTPIVGIEWEERTYVTNSGSLSSPTTHTEWVKKRIYDTREVPNHQLVKGSVTFNPASDGKQYRNVTVHSPARLDQSDRFVSDLAQVLLGITNTLSEYKLEDGNNHAKYVRYSVANTDLQLAVPDDYNGIHRSAEYLQYLEDSTFSGIHNSVYQNIYSGFMTSVKTSGEYLGFYSVNLNSYIPEIDSATNVTVGSAIEQATNFALKRIERHGTSDSDFLLIRESVTGLISVLNNANSFSYWPLRWNYDGVVGYSGIPLIIPEYSGFGYAEVNTTNDYLIPEMFKSISSSVKLFPEITGTYSQGYKDALARNDLFIRNEAALFYRRTHDNPTLDGFDIVDTWYTRHDRLGRYAGNFIDKLIGTYDNIKSLYTGSIQTGYYIHTTGMDLASLDRYFYYISSGLNAVTGQLYENLYRGGMVDKETIKLIKGYGWYAKNRQAHYSMYVLGLASGDAEAIYAPIEDPDYTVAFSGIYNRGIDSILKSMVTTEGLMMESNYINWNPGPFEAQTPYLIFDAMIPGIQMNRDLYLAKASCVFNTLTGNYYYNGLFLSEPRLTNNEVGAEVEISKALANLYVTING